MVRRYLPPLATFTRFTMRLLSMSSSFKASRSLRPGWKRQRLERTHLPMEAGAERPCLKGPRPSGEELLHLPTSAVGHDGPTAHSRKGRPTKNPCLLNPEEGHLKILIFAPEDAQSMRGRNRQIS